MRTRFIHDKFILDVTHLDLSWTEENSWFKDEFFLTSSFPFDIDFSENIYFEFFQHFNLATTDTYYEGKLEKDGKIEEAILEIEEVNEKLRITIRYGIEALPNWDKKLSELNLEVVLPNGGSMAAHAASIISQNYPEVNYNFPAIISSYYEAAILFDGWEGVINKRIDGSFVSNYIDVESHVLLNRNIVYPFPYHMYVLKSAIEDAGYTLHGDVLTDPDLIQTIVMSGKKIIEFEDLPEPVEWFISLSDIYKVEIPTPGVVIQYWHSEQELLLIGDFHFTGSINPEVELLTLTLNGVDIYHYVQDNGDPMNVNLWFSTTEENNLLECEVISGNITTADAAYFNIKTLQLYDENGAAVPFVANFSNVQLATKLPDMTIGDFIKFHKKLKNYDFDLRENKEIWMNLVQNEVIQSEVVNISDYDIKQPTRKFEQAKSFLLQYEGEYDEKYKFKKIYAEKSTYYIDDFTKSDNTTEININGIPLPIDSYLSPNYSYNPDPEAEPLSGDNITTAVQLSDDAGKLMLVKYDGLNNGNNWAKELTGLDTLNLYLSFWQRWLSFMIHAIKYLYTIKDHPNLLMKIRKKSKLFGFNNFLFVYTINRSRKQNIEELEIEAYSSKV